MLTRIRIEVEEDTPEQCVRALWKYELALQQEEALRWDLQEGIPTPAGYDFGGDLGRELTEEVIEYDESVPAYKARRVVRYTRLDTRDASNPDPTNANLAWLEPPRESIPAYNYALRPGGHMRMTGATLSASSESNA